MRKGNITEMLTIWLSFCISDHLKGCLPLKGNIYKSIEDLQSSVEEFRGFSVTLSTCNLPLF